MTMTPEQAEEYIEQQPWISDEIGLESTRELLRSLGDPQERLEFIHVAGSNGKGSTCAMIERALRCGGVRTGLYTSPHLIDLRERIRICGELVSPEELARHTSRVREAAQRMTKAPSQFEILTAVAMLCFEAAGADIVVLETGMGGRLDSTNVISAPVASVLTDMTIEHSEHLGTDIEQIAREKAGIIRSGSAVIFHGDIPAASDIFRSTCSTVGARPFEARDNEIRPVAHDLRSQRFELGGERYDLALLGDGQLRNAALVLRTFDALREIGSRFAVSDDAIRAGLARTEWQARFEPLCLDPIFVLDGAHNPQCAELLAKNIRSYIGGKISMIMAVLADKDVDGMIDHILPLAEEIFCIAPPSPRALAASELAAKLRDRGARAVECTDEADAISRALQSGRPTVAFGSLYEAGPIREAFSVVAKPGQRKSCIAARRALTDGQRKEKSSAICAKLMELPAIASAKIILSYMAMHEEVDMTDLHEWAAAHGKEIAYPYSKRGGIMDAMIPNGPDALAEGKYGIISPVPERSRLLAPEEIDAIIVPCVGFDDRGGRIGHGAGYYDRYIPHATRAELVLVAFEAQKLPLVVKGRYDHIIETAVSEEKIYRFGMI